MCTGWPGKAACAVHRFCTGLHRFDLERQVTRRGIVIASSRHRRGNYLRKLADARKANPSKPGEVRHVSVVHDERCSLIAGKGPCDCDPEVEILGREQ